MFILGQEEGLLLIFYLAIVFDFVVLLHVGNCIADGDVEHALEYHINYSVESEFSIVCHHDRVAQGSLDLVSFLLFVSDLRVLVNGVNHLHNCILSDYLTSSVYPQEYSFVTFSE